MRKLFADLLILITSVIILAMLLFFAYSRVYF